MARRISAFAVAGLASIGAGVVHATAAGMHAEHELLTRLFVATAAAQVLIGALVLLRAGRLTAIGTALINGAAVVAWAITRVADISWIGGLKQAEAPQFADTACAALGVLATVAALVALRPAERTVKNGTGIIAPAVAVAAVTVAAMLATASHVHSHGESEAGHEHTGEEAAGAHDHATEAATETTAHSHVDEAATADHEHTDDATAAAHEHTDDATTAQAVAAAVWPRPWDPTQPIDFSGVPGVTPEQQARAEALVKTTLEQLPQFADVSTLPALGYRSIGDASTGHEHYINMGYIVDDAFLDPSKPESLVYAVNGDERTLVSAMFIANDRPVDDPELVDFGGGLMQWHVHENLCWGLNDAGEPVVVGLTDANGNCAPPSVHAGGNNPMVHVWIAPHECGPFAALEGHGAGQTGGDAPRVDQCAHEGHGDHAAAAGAAVAPVPYDPTKPIDLSGVEGVTPEQQAYAENLVAVTVMRLPQWSDPAVAEAAGFHSIGDAGTGHEHYVQWDWINDDVWLDPDAPESLVYEPQPDGSKKLVSAMFMLPTSVALEDVPEYGGALMQWHIHDNLCYTNDPVAPQVAGLTRGDGSCRPPLVKHDPAAMIHVWITPHQCGPFAALEGVGAGTVPAGEEHWCDHAHGS